MLHRQWFGNTANGSAREEERGVSQWVFRPLGQAFGVDLVYFVGTCKHHEFVEYLKFIETF